MRFDETVLSMMDSTRLLVRSYEPKHQTAERTLFITHGVCEHGGRYEHIAKALTGQGWRVIVPDLRGHGLSQGTPTHIRSFDEYVTDLHTIRSHFEVPASKTALLGHSMGGLVATRYAQRYQEEFAALVLISPLLGVSVPIPKPKLIAGKVLSVTYSKFRFQSNVDPVWTSHNEEVIKRRRSDPLFHGSVTARWFFAMQKALQEAWEDASAIRVPVILLQAGEDYLVDAHAAESWMGSLTGSGHQFHLFPEHYHELLNERDWSETLGTIEDWLDVHLDQPHTIEYRYSA